MRRLGSSILKVSLAILVLGATFGPARAATIGVDYVEDDDGAHWDPAFFLAHAGDIITFDLAQGGLTPGIGCTENCTVDVLQYAGTGTYFRNAPDQRTLTTSFSGGVVWFATRDPGRGAVCSSACGGYTDRLNAPSAPVIAQPAAGAELPHRDITVSGQSESWTVVTIELDGDEGRAITRMADAEGRWSAQLNALSRAPHTLTVTATDAAGRTSSIATRTFRVVGESNPPQTVIDQMDPFITVDPPIYTGTASDDSGIASVSMTVGGDLNKVYLASCDPACPSSTVRWRIDLPDGIGITGVRLKIEDVYGNLTFRSLTLVQL